MSTCIALLRAINVSSGGKNSIRMADLKRLLEELGLQDVRTYLQSGNAVFRTGKADARKLAARIEARIADELGHRVSVLILSAEELEELASENPLWPAEGGDPSLFHATFLFEPVSKERFESLQLPAAEGERAVAGKGAVLLHCPHGYGRTKLNNAWFEKALGVRATTRNWKTVLALRDLCKQP